jgi:glycosyltransferase involved in cell wall biosynthesis
VLFVGSRNEALHRRREEFLLTLHRAFDLAASPMMRLTEGHRAGLGRPVRAVLATWLDPLAYRELACRSRAIVNFSVLGEVNIRTFEAIASGSILLAERENEALARALVAPGREYMPYSPTDPGGLAQTLVELLTDEPRRRNIAEAAQARLPEFGFEQLLTGALIKHLPWLMDRALSAGAVWSREVWTPMADSGRRGGTCCSAGAAVSEVDPAADLDEGFRDVRLTAVRVTAAQA